jgi:hypothetical protein
MQFIDTGTAQDTADKRTIKTFISGAAITAKDWVQLDTSKADSDRALYAIQAASGTTSGNGLVVGVALDSATAAGQRVRVVTHGYVEGANVANAINAAGLMLVVEGTAGRAELCVLGDHNVAPCGVALETASSNTCDVFVLCG